MLGYEGLELLVGCLLVEFGVDLCYVGMVCLKMFYNVDDVVWLEDYGVEVVFWVFLEWDLEVLEVFELDFVIGIILVV